MHHITTAVIKRKTSPYRTARTNCHCDPFRVVSKTVCRAALSLLLATLTVLTPGISGGNRFFSTVTTAHAEDLGMWYYDEFGIEEAHADGIDGTGIKVADIDTMINTDVPWLADADIVVRDKNITTFYGDISPVTDDFNKAYHATDMLSLLQSNGMGAESGNAPLGLIPGAQIYHYAAVHSDDDSVTGGDIYDEAMKLALEDDVDIIIIPAGGLSFFDKQYPFFLEAIKRGIPVLVAHSNERVRLSDAVHPEYYQDVSGAPLSEDLYATSDSDDEICYWPGLVTVQCINSNRQLQIISDVADPGTDIAAPGENIWMQFYNWGNFEPSGGGCSAATTVAGGYLTLAMQKWPEATGNQILQLLVSCADPYTDNTKDTTGPSDNPLANGLSTTDAVTNFTRNPNFGFGVIDLQKMLDTDPTDLADVNPILYLDIYRSVENAKARDDIDTLTGNDSFIEIATVLDEQLSASDIERPDFLVTLLGESTTDTSGDKETSEQSDVAVSGDTADTATAVSETTAEPSPSSRTTKKSGFPLMTVILASALSIGLILVIVIVLIRIKTKKAVAADSNDEGTSDKGKESDK